MTQTKWILLKVLKDVSRGSVWLVEDDLGNRGYLKFSKKNNWYFSGPLIANEYITRSLARRLGFPTASLELANIRAQNGDNLAGVISREISADQILTWSQASERYQKPEFMVNNIDLLRQLVVFDAWITNIDRGLGDNLILYRESSDSSYNWYLIDHGHALFGSPQKWKIRGRWNSDTWQKLWRCCKAPPGIVPLRFNMSDLNPMIKKIESLRESEIEQALNSVPKRHLSKNVRAFTKRLLLTRQKQLRKIIRQWIRYKSASVLYSSYRQKKG